MAEAPSFADVKALAQQVPVGVPPSFDEVKNKAAFRPEVSAADFGQQFMAGISDVVGPINPLRRLDVFKPDPDAEPTLEPTTLSGRAGRLGGQALSVAPLLAAGTAALPLAAPAAAEAGLAAKFGKGVLRFFPQAGRTFLRTPKASLATETIAGAGAGAGGHAALQVFPDSDGAQLGGELVGGFAPAVLPVRLLFKGVQSGRDFFRRQFGTGKRVAERARRAVPEGQREEVVGRIDEPTTIDPETGKAVLTPSVRTGESGLMALEEAVANSSDALRREFDDQIARARQVIEQSFEEIGAAHPSAAPQQIKEMQDYLNFLLDTRLNIAVKTMDERVANLGPSANIEQVNRIAGQEIESALAAARAQEKQFYALVPQDAATPTTNATAAYRNFLDDLPEAQLKNIPKVAREFLHPGSGKFFKQEAELPGALQLSPFEKRLKGEAVADPASSDTTIKELRGVQSELREVARNARAGKKRNLNKARIADELADAITEDIAATKAGAEGANAVKAAVDFSRNLNERFSKGTIGRVLGRDVRGTRDVPKGLTLEQTLGVSGPKAREGFDDLMRAFDSPEAPSSEVVVNAAKDYMKGQFFIKAFPRGGAFNAHAARKFINDNAELLNRMPVLRSEMERAVESGNTVALRESGRKFIASNMRTSKATLFINKESSEAFRQISQLSPPQAGAETQKLLRTVGRDATGEATEGLKAGFRDLLINGARTSSRDINGGRFLSGFALKETLADPSMAAIAKKLFTTDELKRIDIITKDLINLEKRLGIDAPLEGITLDKASKVLEVAAGLTGAAVGRTQAARLGIGGTVQIPGIFASKFRELVNAGVKDPVTRLLSDAIRDEDLFRDLLLAPLKDGKISREATRTLNAWVAVVLAEHGGVLDQSDDEQDPGALLP